MLTFYNGKTIISPKQSMHDLVLLLVHSIHGRSNRLAGIDFLGSNSAQGPFWEININTVRGSSSTQSAHFKFSTGGRRNGAHSLSLDLLLLIPNL
jgi:hypothetical protein